SAFGRLTLVPLAVVCRRRVDVVRGVVAVLDVDVLADHDAEDVRVVAAAFLIEFDRSRRRIERAAAEAVFHVHEDVGQVLAIAGVGLDQVLALLGAGGVLRHIDFGGLGLGAIEAYGAGNRADRALVDRSRRRRGRGSRLLSGRLFFLAT